MTDKKQNKGSVYAAVAAATGLGNAFRFPALCTVYGCSFLFAYAVCLAFVCYPLLCAELKFGRRKKNGGFWKAVFRAAAVNSAVISLYYSVVCVKLGTAFTESVTGNQGGFGLLAAAAIAAAAFFILRGKKRALAVTGRLSIICYLALFSYLTVLGSVRGVSPFKNFPVALSALGRGALWTDALGQSLLSLSLAAGVMPALARTIPENSSVKITAAKIVFANFAGCVLSLTGTLSLVPEFPQTEGLSCALVLFKSILSSVASTPAQTRAFGAAAYFALTAIALHSTCSLALPALSVLPEKFSRAAPFAFVSLALALYPLFSWNGGQIMNACDRMACSVCAVIIAFCECLYFAFCGSKNIFIVFICPAACGILAVLSFCGARFDIFAPQAVLCACVLCIQVVAAAAAPPVFARIFPRGIFVDRIMRP